MAFTYTGNSFANSTIVSPNAAASVASDTAGESLFGRNVHYEPTGPNTPLARNSSGEELYPGPGENAFVDRCSWLRTMEDMFNVEAAPPASS